MHIRVGFFTGRVKCNYRIQSNYVCSSSLGPLGTQRTVTLLKTLLLHCLSPGGPYLMSTSAALPCSSAPWTRAARAATEIQLEIQRWLCFRRDEFRDQSKFSFSVNQTSQGCFWMGGGRGCPSPTPVNNSVWENMNNSFIIILIREHIIWRRRYFHNSIWPSVCPHELIV